MGIRSSKVLPPPSGPPPPTLPSAQPALAEAVRRGWASVGLGPWPSPTHLPIIYSHAYNIRLYGLENLHPFDCKKFEHVVQLMESRGVLHRSHLVIAAEATLGALRDVHAEAYLQSLERSPLKVAEVTEMAPLAAVPAVLLRSKVLRPMRLMAGGSVQAGAMALERGWAINLGGGMHHAHYFNGGGWCCYDDITLMLRTLRTASGGAFQRAMVVDLDVHQGNGVARSKLHHDPSTSVSTFIIDVYNADVFPKDEAAKAAIDIDVPLATGTDDEEYLTKVQWALEEGFRRCQPPPQLVVFNAGTDVLVGDPLGRLRVSEDAVVKRDAAVFDAALGRGLPVVMLLSGGYTRASAPCIARSVENLVMRFGLVGEGREGGGGGRVGS